VFVLFNRIRGWCNIWDVILYHDLRLLDEGLWSCQSLGLFWFWLGLYERVRSLIRGLTGGSCKYILLGLRLRWGDGTVHGLDDQNIVDIPSPVILYNEILARVFSIKCIPGKGKEK
jgi:hypothetical protein